MRQLWFNWQRQRLANKANTPILSQFLTAPLPDNKLSWRQADYLVVDFETTGLNAKTDQLLSIGAVPVVNGMVQLAYSKYWLIKQNVDLQAENVAIHQLTDSTLAQGVELNQAITELLELLTGKVMVAHFASIEIEFLQQACKQLWQLAPIWPIVDTLAIEKNRLDKRNLPYDANDLRLINLRAKYGLPEFTEHHALNDAIATAELLLAQLSQTNNREQTKIGQLLR